MKNPENNDDAPGKSKSKRKRGGKARHKTGSVNWKELNDLKGRHEISWKELNDLKDRHEKFSGYGIKRGDRLVPVHTVKQPEFGINEARCRTQP